MKAGDWIKLAGSRVWHAAVDDDRIACGPWTSAASIERTMSRRPPHKFCCPKCVELVDARLPRWLRKLLAWTLR